jgi:hypothetical protein
MTMNSEFGMVAVAAVCDRRRVNSEQQAGCRFGFRISEQKQTKETKSQSRSRFSTSFSLFATVQNQAHSSLIKPNQAISCPDAIQSQPPAWSKIATSPVLIRQTPSKPVKAFRNLHLRAAFQRPAPCIVVSQAKCSTHCGLLLQDAQIRACHSRLPSNPVKAGQTNLQSAIRNPQFQLVPLNSTFATPAGHAPEPDETHETPASCANSRSGNDLYSAPSPGLPIKPNQGESR